MKKNPGAALVAEASTSNGDVSAVLVKSEMISLEKIFPSPTQPRTHFSPEKQSEMENSMRSIGFTISTLLVRPSQDRYELVAGERRYRAAKAVGITEAPCIVQNLSDREVLEIQLIENAQREDLTVMEEAIGYGRLLDLRDENGALIYTAKTLAQKIGKDLRTVERLRKLRVLADDPALKDFRDALEKGVVTMGHAVLVTGVPDPKQRAKFAKEILAPKYHEAPLSTRRAELLRQQDYMVDLRNATFDTKDADLLPIESDAAQNRLRGGACTDCPFKAGNALDAFDGELPTGMHSMCMNPSCYAAKTDVGWKQWQEHETDPARNRLALSEAECKKLYQYGDQLNWNAPYVDLADKPDSSDLKAGVEAPGTWRAMLKGITIEVIVARDRNGRKHELVDRTLARVAIEKAAKDAGEKTIFKPESKSGNGSNGHKPETPEEKATRELKTDREDEIGVASEDAIAAALVAKASNGKPLPAGFWVELMETWLDDFCGEAPDDLERRRGWPDRSLISQMKKLEPHHQVGVVVEFLHRISAGAGIMKLYGVDGKKIAKETEATLKAEHKKRDTVTEEIARLAGVATLKDKDLDSIAQALWKKKFATLRSSTELEAVRDEIEKRSAAAKNKARK